MEVSLTEAVRISDISLFKIRQAIEDGELKRKVVPYKKGTGYKWKLERDEVIRWAKKNQHLVIQTEKPKPIKKCDLPIYTEVKYTSVEESRNNESKVGIIEKIYDQYVLIRNKHGYRECFSHFDYQEGLFEAK